jgi:hypothetical protein
VQGVSEGNRQYRTREVTIARQDLCIALRTRVGQQWIVREWGKKGIKPLPGGAISKAIRNRAIRPTTVR